MKTTTQSRLALLAALGLAVGSLFGCDSEEYVGEAETCDGAGELVTVGDEELCVYTLDEGTTVDESAITETGFRCPPNMPHAFPVGDEFVVCSNDPGVGQDTLYEAVEEVTGMLPGDRPHNTPNQPNQPEQPGGSSQADKVDILWVVDDSGSMCEEQASVRAHISDFIDELADGGVDFQLAVVSTDMQNPTRSGRFQNVADGEGGPQCNVTVDVSACEGDSPLIISSTDPRYQGNDGALDRSRVSRDFGCNASVGTSGTGFEMGLDAARAALSPQLAQSANAGFLRDDAMLAVIFLTDENDCSNPGTIDLVNGSICEWESDKLTATAEYVQFFSSLKSSDDQIIMGGVIGPNIGVFYNYGEEIEPSCFATDENGAPVGQGYAGYRYEEVIESFGHNVQANICDLSTDPSAFAQLGRTIREAMGR